MSKPTFSLLLTVIIWSTPSLAAYFLKNGVNGVTISFIMQLIALSAAIIVYFVITFKDKEYTFKKINSRFSGKGYFWLSLAGVAQTIMYITSYYAVQKGNAIQATMILDAWPVLFIIITQIFPYNDEKEKEKINPFEYLLIMASLFGVYLIILNKGTFNFHINFLIIFMALSSAFAAAVYSYAYEYSKKYLSKNWKADYKTHSILFIPRIFSGLIFNLIIILIFKDYDFKYSINNALVLLYMGIFIAFVAHIFFTYALFTANNKYITVFMNLAPGITLFLFWIIFNNTIELQTALGIAIIVASILLIKLPKKEKIISED